jgi:UDP-2,4-diacetamido-2,4,6-trideoxy-beta-L-altropyranose hydrolase
MISQPLLIRADASVAMGTGHIMRCLGLAQAWQDAGGRAIFAIADATTSLRSRLSSEKMEVLEIESEAASEGDALRVVQFAIDNKTDWVVVDGYHFSDRYEHELKSAGLKVLHVDDGGFTGACVADLVLNSNSDATESMYPECKPQTRLLLGTRYVLLRREFSKWREWRRETPLEVRSVLVTMGGSDPDNLTALAIRALSNVKAPGLRVIVVAGGSNPHLPMLQKEVSESGVSIQLHETARNVPELMSQADLAVVAGGGTLWELMYMSCPVLSFGRSPLQRRILEDLKQRGLVEHLGNPHTYDPSKFVPAIEELAGSQSRRAKMTMLGRQQVDGEGARRVCEALTGSN